jgi:hypothetical protein
MSINILLNPLSSLPGHNIDLTAEVLDINGFRADPTVAPIVNWILDRNEVLMPGFPATMTRESIGYYTYLFEVGHGLTAVGPYIASISWQNPSTGDLEYLFSVIDVVPPVINSYVSPM